MTWGDVYVVVTLAAFLGLVAVFVGWSIDTWPELRARNEEHRVNADWYSAALSAYAYSQPGTISNPGDPSPRRRTQ